MDDPDFRNAGTLRLARGALSAAPLPWDVEYVRKLSGHDVWYYQDPEEPAWVKYVTDNRELLHGEALVIKRPNVADAFFKVVYAVKSPRLLVLCPNW